MTGSCRNIERSRFQQHGFDQPRLEQCGRCAPFTSTGLDRVLKSGPVSGLLSGAMGGFANVQADSLINHGTFSTDSAALEKSMYEMGVVGGLFGLTASGMARLSARMSPEAPTRTEAWNMSTSQ